MISKFLIRIQIVTLTILRQNSLAAKIQSLGPHALFSALSYDLAVTK